MIGILNYGLGNVEAFKNIYRFLNKQVKSIESQNDFNNVTHLILPGVGSFDLAIKHLRDYSLDESLHKFAIDEGKPVLGVCLGMQIMARSSEEGLETGLSWIPGNIKKIQIPSINKSLRLPHMGWNEVNITRPSNLFKNIKNSSEFYFLHKYCFFPDDDSNCIATTDYGEHFCSAISKDNLNGVQFHPEKSHGSGIQLLKNFSEI